MAGPMGRFSYVSDDGTTYVMRLDASNAAAVGGTAAAPGVQFPKGRVPRYLLAQHPTSGRERRIVVPDPASATWTGSGGTISLTDYATNAAANFNILGRVGERRYARA
jgi:hypothetical protein